MIGDFYDSFSSDSDGIEEILSVRVYALEDLHFCHLWYDDLKLVALSRFALPCSTSCIGAMELTNWGIMRFYEVCRMCILGVADIEHLRHVPRACTCCHRCLIVQAAQTQGHRGDDVSIAVDGLEDEAGSAALGVAGGLLAYGLDVRRDVSLRKLRSKEDIMECPQDQGDMPRLRPRFVRYPCCPCGAVECAGAMGVFSVRLVYDRM